MEDEDKVCPHCKSEEILSNKPTELLPGHVLKDRFLIGKTSDAGGLGIVYVAFDLQLKRKIAIKEFFPTKIAGRSPENKADVTVDDSGKKEYDYRMKRFLEEARTMARFGVHPNVINVHEFFEANNTAYIVMDYLDGSSVASYLKKNKMIETGLAIFIIKEVCKAVKTLHAQGVIHRDIAPDNIFLCNGEEFKVKLLDLGSSSSANPNMNDSRDFVVKSGYSPLEQYPNQGENAVIDTRSDIYALGSTLYHMVTGVKPDSSKNRTEIDKVKMAHIVNPSLTPEFGEFIYRAMSMKRENRYKDINEFIGALDSIKKYTRPEKKTKKSSQGNKKVLGGVIAGVAALALIGGTVYLVSTMGKNSKKPSVKPAAGVKITHATHTPTPSPTPSPTPTPTPAPTSTPTPSPTPTDVPGSVDVSTCVIDEGWWDYDGTMPSDGVYTIDTAVIAYSIQVSDANACPLTFSYYYAGNGDSYDYDNQTFMYGDTISPRTYNNGIFYDIDYTAESFEPGYYGLLIVNEEFNYRSEIICQVVESAE